MDSLAAQHAANPCDTGTAQKVCSFKINGQNESDDSNKDDWSAEHGKFTLLATSTNFFSFYINLKRVSQITGQIYRQQYLNF